MSQISRTKTTKQIHTSIIKRKRKKRERTLTKGRKEGRKGQNVKQEDSFVATITLCIQYTSIKLTRGLYNTMVTILPLHHRHIYTYTGVSGVDNNRV